MERTIFGSIPVSRKQLPSRNCKWGNVSTLFLALVSLPCSLTTCSLTIVISDRDHSTYSHTHAAPTEPPNNPGECVYMFMFVLYAKFRKENSNLTQHLVREDTDTDSFDPCFSYIVWPRAKPPHTSTICLIEGSFPLKDEAFITPQKCDMIFIPTMKRIVKEIRIILLGHYFDHCFVILNFQARKTDS